VVRISLSYEDAIPENSISVQGTLGSVAVDFDLDTATIRRRTHASFDVELLEQSLSAATSSLAGGLGRAASVVAGKAGIGSRNDPFTASIHRSVGTFYDAIGGTVDRRHSGSFSTAVVELARTVADACAPQLAAAQASRATPATRTRPVPASDAAPEPAGARGENEILVVGGTGFIGSEFVRRAARTNRVVVIARNPARVEEAFEGFDVDVVPGDLRDTDALLEHVTRSTVVCQLFGGRGSTWEELEESHVRPTIRLAEGSRDRGAARFLYTSSIALYDAHGDGTITEDTPASAGMMRVVPYARAKAAVEDRLMAMHRETGFPVVIARPGVVLGVAGDPCHWGVAEWQHSNVCTYWGSGTNPLPLVLVDDVADALTAMCTVPGIEGRSYNLAADTDITAEDYVAEMQSATGRPISARRRSNPSRFAGQVAKWGVKRLRDPDAPFPSYANSGGRSFASRFDSGRARRELGWQPVDDRAELLKRGVAEPAVEWAR
jgi:nucleoside-diphosphate-sugar epimerase